MLEDSSYTITVTVENSKFDFISPMTETLSIKTSESKDLPKIDKFDVVPDSGEMFDQEFNIIMENYLPKKNMKYDLYGIT